MGEECDKSDFCSTLYKKYSYVERFALVRVVLLDRVENNIPTPSECSE
jgi:hypothetical protein